MNKYYRVKEDPIVPDILKHKRFPYHDGYYLWTDDNKIIWMTNVPYQRVVDFPNVREATKEEINKFKVFKKLSDL